MRANLGTAVTRGLRLRCPACGKGRLFSGYIAPRPVCEACGENLAPFVTADFAPYLVTFSIALTFTPAILAVSTLTDIPEWLALSVGLFLALGCALLLLPRAKGAAVALLWSLNIRGNA
jgi:uncharacterized protein (DUF983 family)